MEAGRLSEFYHKLLDWKQTFNLRTVVAATFHNIQPRAGDNIKDFTAINMWYKRLDMRYNFSLGPNLLPLLTTDSLTLLANLDPPYLNEYNKPIQDCLNYKECDNMARLIGKTTIYLVVSHSFGTFGATNYF